MQTQQKQSGRASRKKTRRKDDEALKNIVSLRISDQEKRVLERITESTCKNVSELVREAIEFWLAKRSKFTPKPDTPEIAGAMDRGAALCRI